MLAHIYEAELEAVYYAISDETDINETLHNYKDSEGSFSFDDWVDDMISTLEEAKNPTVYDNGSDPIEQQEAFKAPSGLVDLIARARH